MPEFNVERGRIDIGTGQSDHTVAVADIAETIELIGNNRGSGGGPPGVTVNQSVASMGVALHLTSTTNLRANRATITGVTRTDFELLEFLGDVSSPNAWIVRSRDALTIAAGSSSASTTLANTPTDIDRCIPFVSLYNDNTIVGAPGATAIAYLTGTNTLNVERGGNSGNTVVRVVTVEFVGSNWEVYHGSSGSVSADTGTIVLNTASTGSGGSTGDVTDWGTAVIFGQFRGDATSDANDNVADHYPRQIPGVTVGFETVTVDWAFHADHVGATNIVVCHVLRHPEMVVTRYLDNQNAEGANNIDITSAGLTTIDEAFCVLSHMTSGANMLYGRGWGNVRLTSLTNAEVWKHRNNLLITNRLQVVDLFEIGKITGSGDGEAPFLEADAVGSPVVNGSGTGTSPFLEADGVGIVPISGSGTGIAPFLEADVQGSPIVSGSGVGVLPFLEAFSAAMPLGCVADLAGSYSLTSQLEGGYSLVTGFDGDYDLVSNLTGGVCMAVENQTDEMFAGNRHVLNWDSILDDDGVTLLNLTGRIVKFALARISASGQPVLTSPILDFRSDAPGSRVTVPNPVTGSPHVQVELLEADTATLAPKRTTFYGELEVFQSTDDEPVVVATVLLTIKPNVENI